MSAEKEDKLTILNYLTHALSDRSQIGPKQLYQFFSNLIKTKKDKQNDHFRTIKIPYIL